VFFQFHPIIHIGIVGPKPVFQVPALIPLMCNFHIKTISYQGGTGIAQISKKKNSGLEAMPLSSVHRRLIDQQRYTLMTIKLKKQTIMS
jgi:hypothetical protein